MIAKIVEMDKKARDMTDEAQKNKLDYENQIIAAKENIKNDYLERAKKWIAINEESARKKADASIRQIKERDGKIIDTMNDSYKKNCDTWVSQIVARVTG